MMKFFYFIFTAVICLAQTSCFGLFCNAVAYESDDVIVTVRKRNNKVIDVLLGRHDATWRFGSITVEYKSVRYNVVDLIASDFVLNSTNNVVGQPCGLEPITRGKWKNGTQKYNFYELSLWIRGGKIIALSITPEDPDDDDRKIIIDGIDFNKITLEGVKKFAGKKMKREAYFSVY